MACKEEALAAKARVEAMEQVIGELTATCQSDGLSEFEAEKAAYIANIKKVSAGLQTGAEAVNTGIEKAYVGLTALADSEKGMSALREGGENLRIGTAMTAAGLADLHTGVLELDGGLRQFKTGTEKLGAGTLLFYNGMEVLNGGTGQFAAGFGGKAQAGSLRPE